MCVTEYCHLYLAFSGKDWALNYSARGWRGEPCDIPVSTQSQHEEVPQMWKCCWPRPFFFQCHQGHRAAVLPRCIQLCRVKGVESRAPPGHQPSDTCVYESQARCQHHDQHASHSCLTHTRAFKTTLSVHAQTAQAGEYINHGLHSALDGTFLLWLHILNHAKIRYVLHTEFSWGVGGGGWDLWIGLMNHATWYCLIECTKSKLDSH